MVSNGDRNGLSPCLLFVVTLIVLFGMKEDTCRLVATAILVVDAFKRMPVETRLLLLTLSVWRKVGSCWVTIHIAGFSFCIIRIAGFACR